MGCGYMPEQTVATINALIADANSGDGTDIGAYEVQPPFLFLPLISR